MSKYIISEAVEFLEADSDNQTVQQIIIREGQSKNNRLYPKAVLQTATPLFENAKTFADHPTRQDLKNRPERSFTDVTGWLSNVRYDESQQAIVATRHFSPNQKGQDAWKMVYEIVHGNAPTSLFGASINALGDGKPRDDGILEVTAISHVLSVDDVTTPAAGGGFTKLTASVDSIVPLILSELTYREWADGRTDYRDILIKKTKKVRQTGYIRELQAQIQALEATHKILEATNVGLTSQLTTALSDHETVSRELMIEKHIRKLPLSIEGREQLRQTLIRIDESEWQTALDLAYHQAKRETTTPRQPAPQRVHIPVSVGSSANSLKPRADEDFNAWQKRINQRS